MTTAVLDKPTATTVDRPVAVPERKPIEKVSIICSKGTLDMAYPGLIMANAARMSGIDATLFFTFWG
ncbi:MAG: DsrE/DsrF/DrsH-like family protein, partial [Acidobacteriota bacterium]|nr:DsrE/DsrF/DrsH-like family protein [Acidobacteriota bacterium]